MRDSGEMRERNRKGGKEIRVTDPGLEQRSLVFS